LDLICSSGLYGPQALSTGIIHTGKIPQNIKKKKKKTSPPNKSPQKTREEMCYGKNKTKPKT
jgi:hypothetical protein